MPTSSPPLLLLLLSFLALFNVGEVGARKTVSRKLAGDSPFTAKASFIRYWKRKVSGDLPLPEQWFLNKASPLDGVQLATFSKLADQNLLTTQLPAFCSEANLLCSPEVSSHLAKSRKGSHFTTYDFNEQNFTNYGAKKVGGSDSFKNYSTGENVPFNSFRHYSSDSVRHDDKFSLYALDTNVVDERFSTYGTAATGGSGDFTHYADGINIPGLKFATYSDDAKGRKQDFTSYSDGTNVGNETFKSYGQNGDKSANDFTSYGNNSNVHVSAFSSYGRKGIKANDSFTTYGTYMGNTRTNLFNNYEAGGDAATASFANYRNSSYTGGDAFKTYGKGSKAPNVSFKSYGQSIVLDPGTFNYGDFSNVGSDNFTSYAKGAENQTVRFTTYGVNATFKGYAKKGVTFSDYKNGSSIHADKNSGKSVVNRWFEPGKFFREEMLKTGNVMPMPDIRDKMPKRSFLPRLIASKLPFSSRKIQELQRTFRVRENSTLNDMFISALVECERAPSPGETKQCVGSPEDMLDFATSVLGRNVAVRTTENVHGSKGDILIGSVKKINAGKLTKSVSCHQSLFPYLLYYCHSVPKVRLYEADILDPNSKAKINHGIAICHIDTSSWSPSHGAFIALGQGPGKIEVCHWIFENDLTWTIVD